MLDVFDKYTLGDFVVWLFNYAEEQDDDYFDFCHRVYDELVAEFVLSVGMEDLKDGNEG